MLPEVVEIGGGMESLKIAYYLLALNMFLNLAACILCTVLFIKHFRMIVHGTTTWEEARKT